MKNLKLTGLVLSFMVVCMQVKAQDHVRLNEPKQLPNLFTSLPDRIPVEIYTVKKIVNAKPNSGQAVAMDVRSEIANQKLSGKVSQYNSQENDKIRSVTIIPEGFPTAKLTWTVSTLEDGSEEVNGILLSPGSGDAFILEKENEKYYLVKKNMSLLMNE